MANGLNITVYVSQRQTNEVSNNLQTFKDTMPSEFSRKPRSLKDIDRWKATEKN